MSEELQRDKIPTFNFESMKNELYRLSTFEQYPINSPARPIRLAKAGFVYQGNQDEVECFQCNLKYSNWQKDQEPLKIHLSLAPNCKFITNHPNVYSERGESQHLEEVLLRRERNNNSCDISASTSGAINESGNGQNAKAAENLPKQINEDVDKVTVSQAGHKEEKLEDQCFENNNNGGAEDVKNSLPCVQTGQKTILNPLGVITARPKYPSFAIESVRQASYKKWPSHLKQQPFELGKAGFFYEGRGDHVRCFFCAGGLKEWEPEDNPWIEHARWFPQCVFLRQCKGDQFVMDVQSGIMDNNKTKEKNGTESNDIKPATHCSHISMADPAVVSVIEMGYSTDTVKMALTTLRKIDEEKKVEAADLLQVILDMEDIESDIDCEINHKTEESGYCRKIISEIHSQETKTLVTQNQNLKEMRRCKICLDEEASIVFLPCGHLVSCASCAPALLKCPICRTYVRGTVKAILS